MVTLLLILCGGAIAFIFARSFFTMLFSMQNYGTQKERMKQLRQMGIEAEVNGTSKMVNITTKPIVSFLSTRSPLKNAEALARDLKFIGWDQYMDPYQYRALNILFKITGVVAFFAIYPIAPLFAFVALGLGWFLFPFMFKNAVKEKKKKLFNQFPDFIRIIQGYLMAGLPLTKAVEETIPYVGDDWKYVLKDFVLNCDLHSIPEAIDILCEEVNIFEVKEFFSLIKLNLEQGINIKECFESQTEKVAEMLMESILNQIGRRQMMSKVVQGPLILCIFVVAGLPTFYTLLNFTG